MYNFIEKEQVVGIDCDDTLVLWRQPMEGEETIDIVDPYDGNNVRLVIHKPHVKLLKDRYARGCHITVWSQGGPRWAKAVVDALGVQESVSTVQAKPFMIVDDLAASEWLKNRVFLDPSLKYGSDEMLIPILVKPNSGVTFIGGDVQTNVIDNRGVLNGR